MCCASRRRVRFSAPPTDGPNTRGAGNAPPSPRGALKRTLRALALTFLALPAHASGLADEWRDLHGRCADAVTAGALLDLDGLTERPPEYLVEPRVVALDDDHALTLFERRVLRTSARIVPRGVWAWPGGRLALRLLEYPTRPGIRTLCEVVAAPPGAALPPADARAVFRAFAAEHGGRESDGRIVATLADPNPRGCRVLASVSRSDGFFRSSVAEAAGDPACGGPSLTGWGGLNPADVVED